VGLKIECGLEIPEVAIVVGAGLGKIWTSEEMRIPSHDAQIIINFVGGKKIDLISNMRAQIGSVGSAGGTRNSTRSRIKRIFGGSPISPYPGLPSGRGDIKTFE